MSVRGVLSRAAYVMERWRLPSGAGEVGKGVEITHAALDTVLKLSNVTKALLRDEQTYMVSFEACFASGPMASAVMAVLEWLEWLVRCWASRGLPDGDRRVPHGYSARALWLLESACGALWIPPTL